MSDRFGLWKCSPTQAQDDMAFRRSLCCCLVIGYDKPTSDSIFFVYITFAHQVFVKMSKKTFNVFPGI